MINTLLIKPCLVLLETLVVLNENEICNAKAC